MLNNLADDTRITFAKDTRAAFGRDEYIVPTGTTATVRCRVCDNCFALVVDDLSVLPDYVREFNVSEGDDEGVFFATLDEDGSDIQVIE
jgi:hypothetical protein